MRLNVEEITSVLTQEVRAFGQQLEVSEVGHVLEVGDGVARIYGLSNAMSGEMLEFTGTGIRAQVFNLEANSIGAIIFGDGKKIAEGQEVRATGQLLEIPVGPALLGRVVNPLGEPLDGKGPVVTDRKRLVDVIAPGIAEREPVKVPLQTGLKAIDSMTPIGRGQRQLIIGDRRTGKTTIGVDAILNQKQENVLCYYVAVGQKDSTIAAVVDTLTQAGAMDYTTVVVAGASDPAPLQYIAPYAGCAMAEEMMFNHQRDTLVIYDDLSKQAVAYRQLSLVLRRPPGREAYPGDVFYLHSRLLERACRLNTAKYGGGSLTALPIIETQEGEVSAYIPTNVISITDGQIYLQPDLFRANIRPAIDVGISVSRVGGNAQTKAMKDKRAAGSLRLDLANYRDLEAFAALGTELDKISQAQLDRGVRMVEILKQDLNKPLHFADQVAIIFAGTQGYLDRIPVAGVRDFEDKFLNHFRTAKAELRQTLIASRELTAEIDSQLRQVLSAAVDNYLAGKPL